MAILLLGVVLFLGAAMPAQAVNCSDYPNGVIDGFAGTIPPSQLQIDRNCTITNFTASNPLTTNFSFLTQPGQTQQRWLVIFDNVVHTGQMSCNSVAGHAIWFTNGSSSDIQGSCQNLLIPVEKIDKQTPVGQTTASVGVPFTYTLTMPVLYDAGTGNVVNTSGSLNDLHGVTLVDDLNATGVDLTYVSHIAYWEGTGVPVSHTFTNVGGVLTFDDFPIIPAGEQIVIELTVVLDNSLLNTPGKTFVNTAKWDFGRLIDGVFYDPLPGEWGISPPLTIDDPELVVTKSGPTSLGLTLNLGQWGAFTLDVQNIGPSDAWDVTLVDRMPDGPNGGMCDLTPEVLNARVFASDGVSTVPGKGPLVQGIDFALSYVAAPICELTLSMLTPAAVIGPGERLIIDYQTQLDANTQDSVTLTNVAGATQWFNDSSSNVTRQPFDRTLTNGTVGVADHEDAHSVTSSLSGYFFEKSVQNLTSGANPAATAAPGDTLRYTLRLQATDVPLNGLTFFDDLGALNPGVVFDPGSLALVPGSVPPGADASNTNPNAGTNGAGVIDVRGLNVPAFSDVTVQFDIDVAPGVAQGTVVLNQSALVSGGKIADSDDPNINGQADPAIAGDEDATRVVIANTPVGPLLKENTQATAAVGEAFSYLITVPATAYPFPVYDVRILDDLTASAADLRFVGVTKVSPSGSWTPVNTGTARNLVIEDTSGGIDIPAGERIVLEIRVVLENTATNVPGLLFANTATFTHDWVDDDPTAVATGGPSTTPAMTIVAPALTVQKTGPASIALSAPATYRLDVQNVGTSRAWNPTLVDRLPSLSPGGTCDVAPSGFVAQVFQSNGTTPVSGVLVQNTDFTASFTPAPVCEVTLEFLTASASIGPGERLIVSYQTFLDPDTVDGTNLTNVAGATEWFSSDGLDPATVTDRGIFVRTLTDGTTSILDHEDAHTIGAVLPLHTFLKSVENLTTGVSPASQASPGDRLRYTVEVVNVGSTPMTSFSLVDELDRLNWPPAFEPNTLSFFSLPPGANSSGSDPAGGAAGTGSIDVSGLSLPNSGDSAVIVFDVTLASVIPNGSLVLNQAQLQIPSGTFSFSDDPNVGGAADPTQVQISSAPSFLVQKTSSDLTGDPAVLLAGETLRYTITVKNVGTDHATDVLLRDAIPVNTSYVAGSTTLNGVAVADGPSASSPLVGGLLIYAPQDPTPGTMRADTSPTAGNVATLTFDVVVDPGVADGTVIANQAFVTSQAGGVIDRPSDDPNTTIPDDPTRDVVGSVPLLFASKDVALLTDNGSIGVVDPNDVLRYTITVYNDGAVPATAVTLQDAVPAATFYEEDTLTLNGLGVGRPDNGVSPLASGIPISSSDLTPPLPSAGAGTLSPGQSAVVTFDLRVDPAASPGTVISNQAVVRSAETSNLLTDGDGDPATGPEPTLVVVGDGQQLAITKQVAVVAGGPALAGSELEYVITVSNIGTMPATNVLISDALVAPPIGQLIFVPGSATLDGSTTGVAFAGGILTASYSATYGDLAPGASTVLRFRATIDPTLAQGATVTNLARVDWNSPAQSASASVSIAVGGMPGVAALNGSLWHDLDFDRALGAGEPSLAGWLVDLYRNGQVILTATADAAGRYGMAGLDPNDVSGDTYELRFRAPDAVASSAALGTPSSPFTNTPQRVSNVILTSGSNLQGIDLPISPNGVVYASFQRTPITGAVLRLLNASSGTAVSSTCFDDPIQQGQVTRADGFYKFDLNFSHATCPNGGSYLVDVTALGSGFVPGYSTVIPPTSDSGTPPISVPTCGSGPNDAVPTTPTYCEIQVSPLAPPATVPAGTPGTNYHLHLTYDASQAMASSQVFNNHIPLDPTANSVVGVTKMTPKVNVVVGELVPYEIVVSNRLNTPLLDVDVLDRFPAGFSYIEGSARLDGVANEPLRTGRQLEWSGLAIPAQSQRSIALLLVVGAGVTEGEFTNSAQAVDGASGLPLSAEANATVRVVPDPDFACTDVLGKVFDDHDLDGFQDEGEDGLAGVRLVTARGLTATTDAHGRFHITCAVVPNERRGSNFILKLDDRSLPAGYRMSTPQAQVKRATRGKALRFSYGAAIHRVVSMDLSDPVFEPGKADMRDHWTPRIDLLVKELEKAPSTLRLIYTAEAEGRELVEERLRTLQKKITEAWSQADRYHLRVEKEIVWSRGSPPAGWNLAAIGHRMVDGVVGAFSRAGVVEEGQDSSRSEQALPTDEPLEQWALDPDRLGTKSSDTLEVREVITDQAETKKLRNVIPPVRFASGEIDIPESSIAKIRAVLEKMRHLDNVRLHLVGHADDQPLSGALARQYGDNVGLSRERAGEVAEFVQRALSLEPESISFDGVGSSEPVASNATAAGRERNRRVEVEVWYDIVSKKVGFEDVVIPDRFERVKVCRLETLCKMRFREGHARRARIKNLIAPLQLGEQTVRVPQAFVDEIAQAIGNLRDRENVTVKFIGYSDDAPLSERAERIYGTHLALSTARAHRVALAVKEALGLPSASIASEGRGTSRPVASNATERGRALNRRVEVEIWHDDPLQELPDEPQICPDDGGSEVQTRTYDPPWGRLEPILVEEGEPIVPEGYAENLRRALEEVRGRPNARLRFVGYVRNERLDRRMALAYEDDIGLSTARARRTMQMLQAELGLPDGRVEHEGRGFLHSNDVVNAGFLQGDTSEVRVSVVYDELVMADDLDGIDITRVTREIAPQSPLELNMMRISVDGVPIDDPGRSSADLQRCTDVALDGTDIRFHFDELEVRPRLSVVSEAVVEVDANDRRGEAPEDGLGSGGAVSTVRFRTHTNYAHFIERMEVRLFDRSQSVGGVPIAVVAVGEDGTAQWSLPDEWFASPMREMQFVLRAYDAEGRFDETMPQPLWLVHEGGSSLLSSLTGHGRQLSSGGAGVLLPASEESSRRGGVLDAAYGEAWPLIRNIPLGSAGTVRVEGEGVDSDESVAVAGRSVPVHEDGRFIADEILPSGMHTVEVAVEKQDGSAKLYLRDLELDRNDWFYVGIADVTFSGSVGGGDSGVLDGRNPPVELDSNADGRLAFYLTGKFGADWRLTASADTREGSIESIFTNFLDKSPDSLFRRIEPEYYYPTFGDDSTVEEMAPTQGRMFLRLSKEQSHLLWGNFRVDYADNELALVERGVYGANVRYRSPSTTGFGERRFAVDGFAADPGTVSSREALRGTGGSLYYLRRNDLVIGSDRIRIEIRDKDSGIVKSVVPLTPGLDYDIDYLQGRVLLNEPLSATVDDSLLVRTGGLSGDEAWLLVQYEYAPGFDDIDGVAAGGQAHYWLGDFLRLGVTASRDEGGDEDSSLYGANVTLRGSAGSWMKLQFGRSEGVVAETFRSDDGGFEFVPGADLTLIDTDANAYRADVVADLSDFLPGLAGRMTAYGQQLDAGYSAPGQRVRADTLQVGGTFDVSIIERLQMAIKADWSREKDGLEASAQEVNLQYRLTDNWTASAGVRNDMRDDDSPVSLTTFEDGRRTDATLQVDYDSQGAWRAHGFGQGTLSSTGDRESNVRYGVGGAYRVSEKLSMDGEVSHGDGGVGAQLGSTYQYTKNSSLYLTYGLDNERSDAGSRRRGNLITGARSRVGESASIFAENRYTHSTADTGLVQAAGITLDVFEHWTLGANVEVGSLSDRHTDAETRRRAAGGSVGYKYDAVEFFSGIEFRYDDTQKSDGTWSDRTTWLFRNSIRVQLHPDWRLLGNFDHSFSESSQGDFFDGGFTEAVAGAAYRPVDHDRLHGLLKYTYFYNMPAAGQLGGASASNQYIQKSHVASLDVSYDVTRRLSIGGKYAFRMGSVSLDRVDPQFFDNSAHLAILRSDYRILDDWEALVEGRLLELPDIDERKAGALVGLFRHFGKHFKAGVGYNFTDFSEDLTDLSYDHHGWFVNMVGTF